LPSLYSPRWITPFIVLTLRPFPWRVSYL
jgi:hypothetical protein